MKSLKKEHLVAGIAFLCVLGLTSIAFSQGQNIFDPVGDWFDASGNPVSGHACTDIVSASIVQEDSMLLMNMTMDGVIPGLGIPEFNVLEYVFMFDTDKNQSTGSTQPLLTNNLGIDYAIAGAYSPVNDTWFLRVLINATSGNMVNITTIEKYDKVISANISLNDIGNPQSFNWMVYTLETPLYYTPELVQIYDKAPNSSPATVGGEILPTELFSVATPYVIYAIAIGSSVVFAARRKFRL